MTRFVDIYGAAAIMGCLSTIETMEPWQFAAAWKGYEAAHAPPKTRAPSDDQFRAAVARTMH
jgi:hypothetical protein